MKKILSLLLASFCTLSFVQTKAMEYDNEAGFSKVLLKDYTLSFDENKTLNIKNQQGSITIKNWDKQEISISVELVANIYSDRKLKKLEENVKLKMDDNGWRLNTSYEGNIKLKNESYQFNYIIYAPSNLRVNLNSRFGNIGIESIATDSKIAAEFVSFQLNETVGDKNKSLDLYLKFCDDAHIDYVTNLDLEAQFSTIEITKVDKIRSQTRFSKVEVAGNTLQAAINSKHDKMSWEDVEELVADKMEFTNLLIEKLNKTLSLEDIRFGKIRVEEIADTFKEIAIDAAFTPILIELDDVECQLDIHSEFGRIVVPSRLKDYKQTKKMNTSSLKVRKGNKGGLIFIRNKHAKTTIK